MVEIMVIDNFNVPDSGATSFMRFDNVREAIEWAKWVTNDFLKSAYKPGMTAEELWKSFAMFGESCSVIGGNSFHGRDYAKARCEEICRA